ncbi:MAG: YjgP/YjgQ family permease [Pedosphaera sp.]|nr:YjgP/YjgQ family permease [Pedosphaera sp.]
MRLVDRHLLRELLVPFAYCLAGFQIFWMAVDLFAQLENYRRLKLSVADVLGLYLWKSPELMGVILPVALLMAALYTVGELTRHNEWSALRGVGFSQWRLSAPMLAVGGLCSVALFLCTEIVQPLGQERVERILEGRRSKTESRWRNNIHFRDETRNQWWRIGAFNEQTGELQRVDIEYWADAMKHWVVAESATWDGAAWEFQKVKRHIYRPPELDLPEIETTNRMRLAELDCSPRQIRTEIKINTLPKTRAVFNPHLSLRDIRDYRQRHKTIDSNRAALLTLYQHVQLAQPLQCLVVILVALPFASAPGRRNVMAGVAASIGIGFAYFILQRWAMIAGAGFIVPEAIALQLPWLPEFIPAIAAWAPNILFGGGGIILMRRMG